MEAIVALFRKAFEALRKSPLLFAFPAACWLVGLVFQNIIGGLIVRAYFTGSRLYFATFGLAAMSGVIITLVVQLIAAYFSAGQTKCLFLANEGKALTPALFTEAYKKFGNRILTAKLIRAGAYLAIGIVGGALSYVLSVLGWLLAALAIGAVALMTMFWEYVIVRDDAQVGPALTVSRQLVAKNLSQVCLPMIAVGIAESIVTSLFGSATAISSLITQALFAPFAGLVLVNLLEQVKTGTTTISG